MGRYKKEPINPEELIELQDVSLINQTIESQITYMANRLSGALVYTDYVYSKEFLDALISRLGQTRKEVNFTELTDKNGEFFCWKLSVDRRVTA